MDQGFEMDKDKQAETLLSFIQHNARLALEESGADEREAVLKRVGKAMEGEVVNAGLSDIEAEEFARKVMELTREYMRVSQPDADADPDDV